MRNFLAIALIAGGCTAAPTRTSTSATPRTYQGAELAPQAHVTLEQARTAALAARAGEITDQELEREAGGSGLRYSFGVVSAGATYEVGVDAQTGVILENAPEGANPD